MQELKSINIIYVTVSNVSFDSAKIIHSEQNLTKRPIAEALLIRNNLTFNGNTPSFNLKNFG